MVFDAGAIVELVYSTPSGIELREAIKIGTLRAFASEVVSTEAKYILCRKLGEHEASSRMKDISDSGLIEIEPLSPIISNLAAKYKCKRSVSLADCFGLALAKSMELPILFARSESEILKEMKKDSFDVEIRFLENPNDRTV